MLALFLLLSLLVQLVSGKKHYSNHRDRNHWDRNATIESAFNITDNRRISAKNIYLPKLFILGAQKCATTTLFFLFEKHHPNVCSRQIKETGYFNNAKNVGWENGIEGFQSILQYNETCQKLVGHRDVNVRTHNIEATPRYFDSEDALLRMYYSYSRELRPKLRFILVLREPVAREFSWYNHNARFCSRSIHDYIKARPEMAVEVKGGRAQWNVTELCGERHCKPSCLTHASRAVLGKEVEALATFGESLAANETENVVGTYSVHLKRWLNYFDRSQFFIANYDTLLTNTTDTVERMTSFLGLPPFPQEAYANDSIKMIHVNKAGVKTTLDCVSQSALHEYYEPYNQELYELLESTRRPDSFEPAFPKFRPSLCS